LLNVIPAQVGIRALFLSTNLTSSYLRSNNSLNWIMQKSMRVSNQIWNDPFFPFSFLNLLRYHYGSITVLLR